MDIALAEAVEVLRAELASAQVAGRSSDIHFPVQGVQLEFHVAITKSAETKGGVKLWVVEAGHSRDLSNEEIHRVVVSLGPPYDPSGDSVRLEQSSPDKP